MSTNTHEFKVKINGEMTASELPAYIRIYNAKTKELVHKIDLHANNTRIIDGNTTLVVYTSNCSEWNISTESDRTLDEVELYSNNVSILTETSRPAATTTTPP